MVITEYRNFENKTTEALVRDSVQPLLDHMPQWVRSVTVSIYDTLGDAVASCRPEPDYRRVVFEIAATFLDCSPVKQAQYMRHEFFHAMLGEVGAWVHRSLILPTKETNPELHAVIDREFTDRIERVTQELTFMFARLLGEEIVDETKEDKS